MFGAKSKSVSAAHMEEYGQGGGFRIRYPGADNSTVAAARQYQASLREQHPGWMSSIEFENGDLLLSVYPLEEAPAVLMRRVLRPAW